MSTPAAAAPLEAARERLEALDERTLREVERAARELCAIVERQAAEMPDAGEVPEPEDLQELRALRARTCVRLLDGPIHALDRTGPERLALAAQDVHARTVDGWIRLLPATIEISGPDAVALAEAWAAPTPWRWVARWVREPRPVPLREVATAVVARLAPERERLDGEIAAALADGLRQVSRQWGAVRLALDAAVDRVLEADDAARAAARTRESWASIRDRIERGLSRRRDWLDERLAPALAAAIVRCVVRRSPPRAPAPPSATPWLEGWRQRCEAVRRELALEQATQSREDALLDALDSELRRALEEEAALHDELQRVVELLRRSDRRPGELKAAVAITPAITRVAALGRAVDAQAAELPARIAIAPPLNARAARRMQPRQVQPGRLLLAAGRDTILPAATGLFGAIEEDQREIAGDIQRACDVVAFALRAAGTGEAAEAVVGEAVDNAVTLLEYRRDAPLSRQADGMRAGAAICRAARDLRVAVHGAWTERGGRAARRQLERGVPAASAALVRSAGRAARVTGGVVRQGTMRALARIGWIRESSAGAVDVSVRPVLPREFAGDVASPDLPALYRHLFRPQPVEDPRFLVGRQAELAAIRDARARWEDGHSAGIVVTGERGSGKTSLINCALLGPLHGLPIDRGELRERVLDEESVRAAVAGIVGAPDPAGLEDHLGAGRRVVVLEELERTFLRHIGHYEAIRALGRLINATSATVLWVVVINEVAFRFLDAAIGLGHRFSHRINAGTATTQQIRDAILVRHNLSGLRLRFEPPAARRGVAGRVRARLNGRVDAEREFFEMVARQSGGVYRTAFNIWVGHIAGIRDGLCSIRAPSVTDLAPLIEDLSLSDLFSLVALLQHGSLTHVEHATVFQQPIENSRAQIDELMAREIIAPDPGRPGYRVRPEAMSVAQEALFRRNLL